MKSFAQLGAAAILREVAAGNPEGRLMIWAITAATLLDFRHIVLSRISFAYQFTHEYSANIDCVTSKSNALQAHEFRSSLHL